MKEKENCFCRELPATEKAAQARADIAARLPLTAFAGIVMMLARTLRAAMVVAVAIAVVFSAFARTATRTTAHLRGAVAKLTGLVVVVVLIITHNFILRILLCYACGLKSVTR